MPSLAAWLLALAWPLAKQVLLALGIGWLTYEGLSLVGAQVQAEIIGLWGQVSADTLKMASLIGIPQSLGIMLGALAGRIALVSVARLGKVTT